MKNFKLFSAVAVLAMLVFIIQGCSFSTANLSSLKVSASKDGADAASFKVGDTIYGKAAVSNNGGKVKVKLALTDGKGTAVKDSDVSLDIDGDGSANYTFPVTEALAPGSYKLTADMLNEAGEKKDSKTASFTVAGE